MFSTFLVAFGLGLAVAVPIGPTGTLAIRHGLSGGWRQTFWIGQGAALTDFLYILATYAGVTLLLTRLTWLPLLLLAGGVLMLGRMALSSLREALQGAPAVQFQSESTAALPWHRALRLGLAVTVVNPATITSWLSLGGSFISANLVGRAAGESILLMSGIWFGTAVWFTLLAGIIGLARAMVGRSPWLFRAVGAVSGLVLAGFAVRFAWQLVQGLLVLWQG